MGCNARQQTEDCVSFAASIGSCLCLHICYRIPGHTGGPVLLPVLCHTRTRKTRQDVRGPDGIQSGMRSKLIEEVWHLWHLILSSVISHSDLHGGQGHG